MLRRVTRPATVQTAVVAGAKRDFSSCGTTTHNVPHPDVFGGYGQAWYKGRGWQAFHKMMPQERMLIIGGSGQAATHMSGQAAVPDPEDPRHPQVKMYFAGVHHQQHSTDGHIHQLVDGHMAPIDKGARFFQLLYANYLEPINMSLNIIPMGDLDRCPNNNHNHVDSHVAGLAALIGSVQMSKETNVMHNSILKADTGSIWMQAGVQILENCVLTSEHTPIGSHYLPEEKMNPYQIQDYDGMTQLHHGALVEPNCYIESSKIGPYCKIGHNSKICRNCNLDTMVFIMPGSILAPHTRCNEGEIWGGSPAVKLGKVNKWEFKRPGDAANFHRDTYRQGLDGYAVIPPQTAYQLEMQEDLGEMMLELEDSMPIALQERVRKFVEGAEPYRLKIARLTQGWSPTHGEQMYGDNGNCQPQAQFYVEPNDDTGVSPDQGCVLNMKSGVVGILNEKRYL